MRSVKLPKVRLKRKTFTSEECHMECWVFQPVLVNTASTEQTINECYQMNKYI